MMMIKAIRILLLSSGMALAAASAWATPDEEAGNDAAVLSLPPRVQPRTQDLRRLPDRVKAQLTVDLLPNRQAEVDEILREVLRDSAPAVPPRPR